MGALRPATGLLLEWIAAASPEVGFNVGMGIAHRRAIAGRIGTTRQAEVGVLEPVVNLGSRLEGLTRQLGVPICIGEVTSKWVRERMNATEPGAGDLPACAPKGMEVPLTVFGLLPPEPEYPRVNDA